MENDFFAVVDSAGFAVSFHSADAGAAPPPTAIPITREVWQDWITAGRKKRWDGTKLVPAGTSSPTPGGPAQVRRIYKADIWRRATEEEAAVMDNLMKAATPKWRWIWADSMYLQSDDEAFSRVESALKTAFGEKRTAELLATSAQT